MSVIYIVFPLALLIAIAAVIAYIWAVRSGQFDDLDTPGARILHDDEPPEQPAADRKKSPPARQ
ncbi:MAG: cbb3-type cytochrome oxidase assembly protein CcoS [Phycisphaerales bacterium]|nr:MAG: cbb3-type cytochrome oxidase assembly protein CcoS [Phycisphaerales bacterium]